ncbi:MAG TPA: energy transducer TonB [Gemmatimonadaceae bacterium]|nr:energy transducer TonB [Gemmatimonadaceae bacterium]
MRRHSRRAAMVVLVALAATLAACAGDQDTKNMAAVFAGSGGRPDELPVMLNKQPPFRYPTAAYAQKIQGNTTLRIFIDANGAIVPDSTTVAEPSGNSSLDSAAVVGARELRFVPAKRNGQGVPISILFPVYWRHPDAPPLPGDTILNRTRTP